MKTIQKLRNKMVNLKGHVKTSDTRLVNDFDGEGFAGNSILSKFDFCRVPFSKCSSKLVFTNSHSFRHHPKHQTTTKPQIWSMSRWIEQRRVKLWVYGLAMYIYTRLRLRLRRQLDLERRRRHFPLLPPSSFFSFYFLQFPIGLSFFPVLT